MKGYLDDAGVVHYTALELQNGRYDYALCEYVGHVPRSSGFVEAGYEQVISGKLKPLTCEPSDVTCLACLAVAPERSTVIARSPHGR